MSPRRLLWVHLRPTLFARTVPGNFDLQNIVLFLTQHIPWALNQSQEEEVQEGVADHVADVDDHLVVDEGGGKVANGHHHCSHAKDWSSKQTEGEQIKTFIKTSTKCVYD